MDQYPYREDWREAVNETVQMLYALDKVVDRMKPADMEKVITSGDAANAMAMVLQYLMG